jgi:large conductance mechanosensitive channel
MTKIIKEFQTFIAKGNVLDLAVALMIGTAFQKIVTSLVNLILMPLISWAVKTDLTQWYITLQEGLAVISEESTLLNPPSGWIQTPIRLFFGTFVQSIVDFIIIAFILFLIIKLVKWSETMRLKIQEEATKTFNHSSKKPTKP